MTSAERRREIYRILLEKQVPTSAGVLAEQFGVTRQIIVKDIALLKAEKTDILSTSKGYLINKIEDNTKRKKIKVCHSPDQIEEELNIIVDFGGRALTTCVEHPAYGTLGETLNIKSRKDVKRFLERLSDGGSEPLLSLTNGNHTHLIEAEDEETLAEIEEALREKGYLQS